MFSEKQSITLRIFPFLLLPLLECLLKHDVLKCLTYISFFPLSYNKKNLPHTIWKLPVPTDELTEIIQSYDSC